MSINKWLIHKLGGFVKEDILPPPTYTIENPKVEKLWVYAIDRYGEIPEKVILEKLAYDFVPEIKSQMKVIKKYGHNREISYRAEIIIVRDEVEYL